LRKALAVLMPLLPLGIRMFIGRKILKWDLAPGARIGRSIILVGHVSMGPESNIGSFNMIRGLTELRLGQGAFIATRNWISAHPHSEFVFSDKRNPCLIMHEWSRITVGHQIDCSDRVELHPHAAIAGYRSQILTHALDLMRERQMTTPVELGHHSAVLSGCIVLNGMSIPARSIISAGSVVTTKLSKEYTLYRGNPAQAVRELPQNMRFFNRGPEEARNQASVG
jgi:acetyltransferase-like isoleucine patch superfamily enzyme